MTAPHDLDAERAVLGALLSGALMADVQPLASADFWRPAHQLIYEAITSLTHDGKPAEPVAVADELRRRGDLTRMGGAPYLHTCMAATPSAANAGHYAGIVREYSQRRQWIEWAVRIQQAAHAPDEALAAVNELAVRPPAGGSTAAAPGRKLILTRASEIEPEPVVWAWEDDGQGRIPAGSLGLFAGREGTGQELVPDLAGRQDHQRASSRGAQGRAAAASSTSPSRTRGSTRSCPGSWRRGRPDDRVPSRSPDRPGRHGRRSACPPTTSSSRRRSTSNDVALVALDPLMSAISDTLDTHVNRQVRQALDPLARMADRTGCRRRRHRPLQQVRSDRRLVADHRQRRIQGRSPVYLRVRRRRRTAPRSSPRPRTASAAATCRRWPTGSSRRRCRRARATRGSGGLILDGPSERTVQDILSVQGGEEPTRKPARRTTSGRPSRTARAGPRKSRRRRARRTGSPSARSSGRDATSASRQRRAAPAGGSRCRSTRATSKRPPHPITCEEAKDANVGTVGNHAKNANAASPGKVGKVGTVDSGGKQPEARRGRRAS